jgi:hypothetical protein
MDRMGIWVLPITGNGGLRKLQEDAWVVEARYQRCRQARYERYVAVVELGRQGYTQLQIAEKVGVGVLLASQSVKDFDRVVFDMVGTKIALQLEGDDAKVMAENLGLVEKRERDIARQFILNQAPHVALVRSNHFEPYIQAELTGFYKTKA